MTSIPNPDDIAKSMDPFDDIQDTGKVPLTPETAALFIKKLFKLGADGGTWYQVESVKGNVLDVTIDGQAFLLTVNPAPDFGPLDLDQQ